MDDRTFGDRVRQPAMPGGESTSAALRRVERERDELLAELAPLRPTSRPTPHLDAVKAERDQALRQRDEFIAAADKLHDSWLGLKAELASAHTEMDATRTARDNLDRELAHTRRQLGDAIRELMDLGGVDLIAPLQPTEGAPKA